MLLGICAFAIGQIAASRLRHPNRSLGSITFLAILYFYGVAGGAGLIVWSFFK